MVHPQWSGLGYKNVIPHLYPKIYMYVYECVDEPHDKNTKR